jgi:hypothetical protein
VIGLAAALWDASASAPPGPRFGADGNAGRNSSQPLPVGRATGNLGSRGGARANRNYDEDDAVMLEMLRRFPRREGEWDSSGGLPGAPGGFSLRGSPGCQFPTPSEQETTMPLHYPTSSCLTAHASILARNCSGFARKHFGHIYSLNECTLMKRSGTILQNSRFPNPTKQ